MFETVNVSIDALVKAVCVSIAFGILISAFVDHGSRGCFCDIIHDGQQARLLDVDVEDVILLAKTQSIEIIDVDGPPLNFCCFLIKLTFTILIEEVFKRKRPVMNESGDNWRVGLIES